MPSVKMCDRTCEKNLENLSENIPCGMYQCRNDEDITLFYVNKGLIELFGYTYEAMDQIFENKFINLIARSDRESFLKGMREQLLTSAEMELECRGLRKDGSVFWMLNKGRLLTDQQGKQYLCCALIDITKQKSERELLRLSLERHQVIMDQTTDIIFEWDMINDTMNYSGNWRKKFGYDAIHLDIRRQMPLSKNIHPEDMKFFLRLMKDTIVGIPYSEAEFRIRNVVGRYSWSRVRATVQFDQDGAPFCAVGVIVDIDLEKKQKQKLLDQAQKDALTGLYNKAAIQSMVESRLYTNRGQNYQALLVIDIDYFKKVNDTYGHQCGDAVLCRVAKTLQNQFRSTDLVGRIGGDEFLVFMPGVADLESVAAKIEAISDELHLIKPSKNAEPITCSIGVALFPYGEIDFYESFKCADKALYYVKKNGRGSYAFYDPKICEDCITDDGSSSAINTEIDSDHFRRLDIVKKREKEKLKWFNNERYESVLRQTGTIAFEYNTDTCEQFIIPPASDYLAGNYDGRNLSVVMERDGVIHPDDLEGSVKFREMVRLDTGFHEMVLRLKKLDGSYCWHRMSVSLCRDEDANTILMGTIIDIDAEMRLREALNLRLGDDKSVP